MGKQFDYNRLITTSSKTLELLRMGLSREIGRDTLDSMKLDLYEDGATFLRNSLIARLEYMILSDKIVDDKYRFVTSFNYPATWWQHFKRDKMPKWYVEKYPVKMQTVSKVRNVKFKRHATYPMSNLGINDDLRYKLGGKEIIIDTVEPGI